MRREKGKIIKWNDDKGFGFILPCDSQKNIFVHIKSFTDRNVRPAENQAVTYTIQNSNGKDAAINVSRSTKSVTIMVLPEVYEQSFDAISDIGSERFKPSTKQPKL